MNYLFFIFMEKYQKKLRRTEEGKRNIIFTICFFRFMGKIERS
jgi:hypothetical protein